MALALTRCPCPGYMIPICHNIWDAAWLFRTVSPWPSPPSVKRLGEGAGEDEWEKEEGSTPARGEESWGKTGSQGRERRRRKAPRFVSLTTERSWSCGLAICLIVNENWSYHRRGEAEKQARTAKGLDGREYVFFFSSGETNRDRLLLPSTGEGESCGWA